MKIKKRIGVMAATFAMILTTGFAVNETYAFADTPCEHDYAQIVTEATCISQGYTEYTCKICGDTYRDNYVEKKGHSYKEIEVPPTCTEEGFTTHFCQVCGYQYSNHDVNATGHKYREEVFAATCTEIGYTVHTCEACGDRFTDEYVPAKGHRYDEDVMEATCTEGGHTHYTCKDCGMEYDGNEIAAKGHSYVEHIVKATCIAYGYTEHICEDCKSRYVTDYVNPIGHDYAIAVVPATEGKLGYTKHTCRNCGYVFLSDYSTSGDNGYIEVPEEPKPEVHTHSYVLSSDLNEVNQTITLHFNCACGEKGTNQVTVIFTDENGRIVSMKPTDGVVDYSSVGGELTASIVDGYGNVLKELKLTSTGSTGNGETPDDSDDHDAPMTEHRYLFHSEMNEDGKYFMLEYRCQDCGESAVNTLMAYFIGTDGETQSVLPDETGKVDFSVFTGKYAVRVIDSDGLILTEYEIDAKETPTQPNENEGAEDKTGGNVLMIILPIVIVVLVIGGAAVFVYEKKKKNKREGE